MIKIKIEENQSLLDIATKQYGSIDMVFDILNLNKNLNLKNKNVSGTEIFSEFRDSTLVHYISTYRLATDVEAEISTNPSDWILFDGHWNDAKFWIDNEFWND